MPKNISEVEFKSSIFYKCSEGLTFDFEKFGKMLNKYTAKIPVDENFHTYLEDERAMVSAILNNNLILPLNFNNLMLKNKFLSQKDILSKALSIIDQYRFQNALSNGYLTFPNYLSKKEAISLLRSQNGIYCKTFYNIMSKGNVSKKLGIIDPELFLTLLFIDDVLVWDEGQYSYTLNNEKYDNYCKSVLKEKIEKL